MTSIGNDGVEDPLAEIADAIIAARAAEGDLAAFSTLVRRHSRRMRAYVARMLGSVTDVDDIVQSAFYIAWQQLPSLRDPIAVGAWLMRIASRQTLTHIRRQKDERTLPENTLAVRADLEPQNVAIQNARLRALSAALDRLVEDQRRCWLLREVAELSYEQIAEELEMSIPTVRGLLARARSNIHAQMEGWR